MAALVLSTYSITFDLSGDGVILKEDNTSAITDMRMKEKTQHEVRHPNGTSIKGEIRLDRLLRLDPPQIGQFLPDRKSVV